MRAVLGVALAATWFVAAASATAHEIRPGYLELRELGGERYQMLWKVPAVGDQRFGIREVLPATCVPVSAPFETWTGDAYVERAIVVCHGGLDGQPVGIAGLDATIIDVLARVERLDGSAQIARLTPAAPSFVVEAAPGRLGVAATYVRLGVSHILSGVDHLLFVLALVLLIGPRRRLLWTVTAFTVAHSITLAAATLGVVHVPPRPVEAVIALSIVFVAAEIVHGLAGHAGLTARQPWVVAFVFGLLHGLGFAGALAEIGLPPHAIPLALLCFNVGVELGQLAFIAVVLGVGAVLGWLAPGRVPEAYWRRRLHYVPPYAIGAVAAYWTIARVMLF